MFVSSDRTGPPSVSEPLTCANNLPLVAAERPQAVTAVTSRVLCQPIRGTYSSLFFWGRQSVACCCTRSPSGSLCNTSLGVWCSSSLLL